jgi:hypothetical protein
MHLHTRNNLVRIELYMQNIIVYYKFFLIYVKNTNALIKR